MKECFPVLSRYNDAANRAMYSILAELPRERLTEQVGSYFKTIMGLLNHLYGSDIIWLQRMRILLPKCAALQSEALDIQAIWPTTDLAADFEELRTKREALDSLIVRFAAELSEVDLERVIDYSNSRGQRKRYVFWQALMHMFNHETHHRGQIAEILDQLGVKNDYSNIITTLEEPPVEE